MAFVITLADGQSIARMEQTITVGKFTATLQKDYYNIYLGKDHIGGLGRQYIEIGDLFMPDNEFPALLRLLDKCREELKKKS
jgi:hypothetical protein